MEMAHFKKYRSFKCLVRGNWVSPFIIITNWEQKLERRLLSLGERIFALDSKYVRYEQKTLFIS